MESVLKTLNDTLATLDPTKWLSALFIFLVGLLIARLVRVALSKSTWLHPQHRIVTARFAGYVIMTIAVAGVLNQFGVSISALLGAAGILTVALGFAAQTVASNMLSGIFLMGEQPFVIGDYVEVAGTGGVVTSIDLLSVRLQTLDNILVRIPNETMLKSNVSNRTHYPIRRLDLPVEVHYRSDLDEVERVLMEVTHNHPLCMESPEPWIRFMEFKDSGILVQIQVWTLTTNFLRLRSDLLKAVHKALGEASIEIPFPQRTITFAKDENDAPSD